MFVYKKKKDVKRDWTKLHREGAHTSYASADVTKIIKFSIVRSQGYIARIQEIKSYTFLVQKYRNKTALGRIRRRREDSVKLVLTAA